MVNSMWDEDDRFRNWQTREIWDAKIAQLKADLVDLESRPPRKRSRGQRTLRNVAEIGTGLVAIAFGFAAVIQISGDNSWPLSLLFLSLSAVTALATYYLSTTDEGWREYLKQRGRLELTIASYQRERRDRFPAATEGDDSTDA